ncbi:hypothetical protein [Flavobacterium rhizosphaerae]|uniref:Uncharacterized protein n=1 Tax=Flavobacterium rhizosphaerae TaxID=3163298 RepID=A0ABW8YUP7_9FLAO
MNYKPLLFLCACLLFCCGKEKKQQDISKPLNTNKSIDTVAKTSEETETAPVSAIDTATPALLKHTKNVSANKNIIPLPPEVTLPVFNTERLPLQNFYINTAKDTVITGKNGVTLTILADTFAHANGKAVTGVIALGLKEALSITDIVTGGLVTLSDGKPLESGGMVYINATSGKEQVYIAEGSIIKVAIPSEKKYLDMKIFKGIQHEENLQVNWVNPRNSIIAPATMDTLAGSFDRIALPVKPLKPTEYKGGTFLKVNVPNPEFYPEFNLYKNVKWKLTDESAYTEGDTDKEWVKVILDRGKQEGEYTLTFIEKNRDRKSYNVIPVFEGKDYNKALAAYNEAYKKYERQRKAYLEYERRLNAETEARKYVNDYVFPINELGWINCDRFYEEPNAREIIVNIELKGQQTSNALVYMIFNERKLCLPIYTDGDGFKATYKLPVGEKVSFIACQAVSKGTLLAVGHTEIKKYTAMVMNLEPVPANKNIKDVIEGKIAL